MNLSIAYITMRKEPMFHWFFYGLLNQMKQFPDLKIQLIIVDYWKEERELITGNFVNIEVDHVLPLPSPWQGKHKITSENWYACANARNSALVYAKHSHIACIDDLTVLGAQWLTAAVDALNGKYIALGAYCKQQEMVVENGVLVSGVQKEDGYDARMSQYPKEKTKVEGNRFYGCSSVMPVEAALKINGFDCLTDSIGYEDCVFGMRLERNGETFIYDKRLFTTESNDHPQKDFVVKRIDKMLGHEKYFACLEKFGVKGSVYPKTANKDCSHILIDVATRKTEAVWNFFSLRELRAKRERGEEITLADMKYPEYTWFDGTLLKNDCEINDNERVYA